MTLKKKKRCNFSLSESSHPVKFCRLKCPRWLEINENIWIWETIRAWAISQISEGWCPFANATARDTVGTYGHRAKHGWMQCILLISHQVNTVFSWNFHMTFIVSFLTILAINQHYVDKSQTMTLPFTQILALYEIEQDVETCTKLDWSTVTTYTSINTHHLGR